MAPELQHEGLEVAQWLRTPDDGLASALAGVEGVTDPFARANGLRIALSA